MRIAFIGQKGIKTYGQAQARVHVFIDAANLWETQKAKGKFIDYEKAVAFLKKRFRSAHVKIFYYTAYPKDGTRNYALDGKHKFYTFLKKGLGFVVRKKELKRIFLDTEEGQLVQEKGNMDVEMTLDAVHYLNHYDTAIFFTGDSDFLALISYLRRYKKQVFVFSSRNNVSKELRTGADGYVDILDIDEDIWGRDLKHRVKNR